MKFGWCTNRSRCIDSENGLFWSVDFVQGMPWIIQIEKKRYKVWIRMMEKYDVHGAELALDDVHEHTGCAA